MSKQRIIVTGGLGYIGSHCTVELTEQGFEVIALDDLSNSNEDVLDGIKSIASETVYFEKTDLKDLDACKAIFTKYDNISGIIHFAAHKAVGESVHKPLKYYRNNINGLLNILDCCQLFNVTNIIFSSSCTVYGETEDLPVTEASPLGLTSSPYGYTKQVGERIISDFTHANEAFRAISLRYFNPIGAHPSGAIGELPLGKPENLMPYITQTAIGLREELSVFGGDYNTPDGTAIRDYIHVVDLARAHVIALERLMTHHYKSRHEYFNLGSGKGYSVLEVIKSFEKVSGLSLPYRIVDRRAGDLEAIYADTTLSNKELGWHTVYTLDDMTKTAWEWEQKVRSPEN